MTEPESKFRVGDRVMLSFVAFDQPLMAVESTTGLARYGFDGEVSYSPYNVHVIWYYKGRFHRDVFPEHLLEKVA